MPFGLTRAPATFSRLIDKVLDDLIGKSCLVYLDDVILYGKKFEETLANLKKGDGMTARTQSISQS